MKPAILFTAAAASYVANCAVGAGAATRMLDTSGCRWVHHALYVCTSTLAGVAASSLLWSTSRAGWALLPAAAPLVLIPRVSTHSRRHYAVALSAAPFFISSTVVAWRA
jgi:hypothetical protein